MPDDALDRVLRLVADGRLTADEAAPILDALESGTTSAGDGPAADVGSTPSEDPDTSPTAGSARAIRIEVSDRGRKVVNLRVPLALGRGALARIPGLSEATAERIREALEAGIRGPILAVDDEGDGVRIVLE